MHDGFGGLYCDLRRLMRAFDVSARATIIVVGGVLLHFLFDWSGRWPPLALFAAVNESVWEHLKIAFWPGLMVAAVWRPRRAAGYWAAQSYGLFFVSTLIMGVFYGYTAMLGRHVLALDIGLFVIAIAAGQAAAARARPALATRTSLRAIGQLLLLAQIAAFSFFTHAPPALAPFQDPRNGRFGLEAVADIAASRRRPSYRADDPQRGNLLSSKSRLHWRGPRRL